jgi:hypothetical protein
MLTLRGMTQREVEQNLPRLDPPIVNPNTGKPYALSQINGDLQKLSAGWREDAGTDIDQLKANHLAELREVRRSGWQRGQLNVVMRSLEQEGRVLGLASDKETAEQIGAMADSFLAGVHTVKEMAAQDLSE